MGGSGHPKPLDEREHDKTEVPQTKLTRKDDFEREGGRPCDMPHTILNKVLLLLGLKLKACTILNRLLFVEAEVTTPLTRHLGQCSTHQWDG